MPLQKKIIMNLNLLLCPFVLVGYAGLLLGNGKLSAAVVLLLWMFGYW